MQKKGNKYGTHRVIEPKGVLPQPANKIDNNMDEIYDNEILIDVQTLNIDSASFTDIHNYAKQQAGEGASREAVMEEVKKEMLLNVELQGKHRNRRTGSGGMLLGRVEKIGDALKGKIDLKEGDKITTLVSLSLTLSVLTKSLKSARMLTKLTSRVRLSSSKAVFMPRFLMIFQKSSPCRHWTLQVLLPRPPSCANQATLCSSSVQAASLVCFAAMRL